MNNKILFLVEESEEGVYIAKATDYSIFTRPELKFVAHN